MNREQFLILALVMGVLTLYNFLSYPSIFIKTLSFKYKENNRDIFMSLLSWVSALFPIVVILY